MTTRRRKRVLYTRTVVRLPERDLAESILDLAAPLLERLGSTPPLDHARGVVELAVTLWNAHVKASQFWDNPRSKPLDDLRRKMCGKKAPPADAETFELLAQRWRKEFAFDPRLVGEWSFELTGDGQPRLTCETTLPDGVEAEVPPPLEKRVAIGGKFLDEVRIRLSANSYLGFPVKNHRGELGSDGSVTIHTRMPAAVALFAEGLLQPVGGAPVDLTVTGKNLGQMVLAEVRCSEDGGRHDVAVLIFRPANAPLPSP